MIKSFTKNKETRIEEVVVSNKKANGNYDYYERKCPNRKTSEVDVTNTAFYKYFQDTNKDIDLSQKDFIKIIEEHNLILREKLLKGELVELPLSIGRLFIMEKRRKFVKESPKGEIYTNGRIDWGKTRKLNLINPETGKLIKQYFSDQLEYYRVYWYCRYSLKNVYNTYFNVANTLKEKITDSLEADNLLHVIFKQNNIKFNSHLEKLKTEKISAIGKERYDKLKNPYKYGI